MDKTALITLIAFTLGIIAIVVLTVRYRWHAFIAILFTIAVIGLVSGLKPEDVIDTIITIIDGFGEMLGFIAIIVISGMIIGEFNDKIGSF